jgi:hypothetical protein
MTDRPGPNENKGKILQFPTSEIKRGLSSVDLPTFSEEVTDALRVIPFNISSINTINPDGDAKKAVIILVEEQQKAKPDERLDHLKVWIDALGQIYFTNLDNSGITSSFWQKNGAEVRGILARQPELAMQIDLDLAMSLVNLKDEMVKLFLAANEQKIGVGDFEGFDALTAKGAIVRICAYIVRMENWIKKVGVSSSLVEKNVRLIRTFNKRIPSYQPRSAFTKQDARQIAAEFAQDVLPELEQILIVHLPEEVR